MKAAIMASRSVGLSSADGELRVDSPGDLRMRKRRFFDAEAVWRRRVEAGALFSDHPCLSAAAAAAAAAA